MTTPFLLPRKYKKMGWVILCSGIALFFIIVLGTGLFAPWAEILQTDSETQMSSTGKAFFTAIPFLLTLLAVFIIGGLLFVALSKEKTEDEFIAKLRKSAFLNAVLYNYLLLMLLYFSMSNPNFLKFFGHSVFNVLLIYVIDFHIRLNYQDQLEEIETLFKIKKTRNAE